MKTYKFFIPIILFTLLMACKEEELHKPLSNDTVKPGVVSNVLIVNKSGAAKITYQIPNDNDLLYIKAEYEIRPGAMRQIKASYNADSLIVDGFGEAKPYQVKLYAVDKAENQSEPVTITVTPLTPPFVQTLNKLTLVDDFGGVNVQYDNVNEADIAIVVLTTDNNNEMQPAETYYTKAKSGAFSVRGYEPKLRRFGVYVRDKFGNTSPTIYKDINPFFETALDRFKFKAVVLPTDRPTAYNWPLEKLWDNSLAEDQGFHTAPGPGLPLWFTIDLGVTAKLSRFKEFQRTVNDYAYRHGNMRKFEVWGTATLPAVDDGNFTGWTKMGQYESIKPSGLPDGRTQEDINYAAAGEEFNIDINAPAVRYIRIKMLQNWANTDFVHLMELQFWGNPN